MSRFVRPSKYRHVFGQPGKREYGIENVKVTNSAWDTNVIAASGRYVSINWNASGGGAFAILPAPSPFNATESFPYKLPDVIPLARSHTAPVLDTDWSPHNDSVVASGGEDGKVAIWKVESSLFEGWGSEHWVPQDFDPVVRIDASPRKIGQVLFHPTASLVLASASGEHNVKLWDLSIPENPRSVLVGHTDAIQSVAFNPSGTLLATTCKDRKIRLFDPRTGGDPVRSTDGHGGVKSARVIWMGDLDKIATTGFSKMSDRQVGIWDIGGLGNIKTTTLDQSSGVVMPFWSDNNILFLAGKGDGNVRYYEWESDTLYALSEHKSTEPQRGMCFLPRRALNVSDCEIARAYKVCASSIEPLAFIVPRKADTFQSDIFPPAPSSEAALSASELFAGKTSNPILISLENGGKVTSSSQAPAVAPVNPTPTRTATAPAPAPQASPVPVSRQTSLPSATSPVAKTEPTPTSITSPFTQEPAVVARSQSSDGATSTAQEENARLTAELRAAREKIRNLELQVEGMKANAQKAALAAQAVLES